jgi:hypothetical protein
VGFSLADCSEARRDLESEKFRKQHLRAESFFQSLTPAYSCRTASYRNTNPNSDVDVLYEFEEGCAPGWEIADIEDELSQILKRKVDFVPAKYLNRNSTS